MPWGRGSVAEFTSAVLLCAAAAIGFGHFNMAGSLGPGLPEELERAALTTTAAEEIDREWGPLSVHAVVEGGALRPPVTGVAAEVWSDFLRIATPEFAEQRILQVRLAHAPRSDQIASVERDPARPEFWTLTINLGTRAAHAEMVRALVHEYAHLLSLGVGQFRSEIGACPTTQIEEGCLLTESMLHRFATRFWTDLGPVVDDARDFVSPYAATNVVEDFAETFAEFVFRAYPDPTAGSWARKVQFLWAEPALFDVRERIRAEFGELLQPVWDP